VLHRFRKPVDGAFPRGSLVALNGTLFGLSQGEGFPHPRSLGTVYEILPSGDERVIYTFKGLSTKGGADGAYPDGDLLNVGGTFYGLTSGGGVGGCFSNDGCGTVFKVTPAGDETVLYRFKGGTDAANPYASLIEINGTLYGTTVYGGTYNKGTVFSVTTSGSEAVLYSFGGKQSDGESPGTNLTNVGGVLYGTTAGGGSSNNGTVFSLTTSGDERVIYSFGGGADGSFPYAGLLYAGGVLYGDTSEGGSSGKGTVFAVTLKGAEKIVHSFKGSPTDGETPISTLIESQGKLYGVTYYGGHIEKCEDQPGCGVIYEITAAGAERVVHSFIPKEGSMPQASLLDIAGVLYGTASSGGGGNAVGTVFAFTL
jgi:uncharacterized repeat protein (TIGR03803 family)